MTRRLIQQQSPLTLLLSLFVGIFLPLLVIGMVGEDLLEKQRFAFETPFLLALHAHATPTLNKVALFFTHLGSATIMAPISLLIGVGLWLKKRSLALFFVVSVVGAAAMNLLLKFIFQRPRPELWPRLVHETDASFPSGHSMYSAAFVTALIVLLWPTRWRYLALVLGVAFTLCVGVSRLYLGVHYPTDVLCGWLGGLAWVMGTRLALPPYQAGTRQAPAVSVKSHQ